MKLIDMALHLQTLGVGTAGKTIFVNTLPADAKKAVLLRNSLDGTVIDYELRGYVKTSFQVIVRSANYADGELLIAKAVNALHVSNTQIGDVMFNFIRPSTEPISFPISEGNLVEMMVEMDASGYQV